MGWLTKLNPFSKLKGERDVIALIYLKYFIPRLEAELYRSNFLLTKELFVTRVGQECVNSMSQEVFSPLWVNLSNTQQYNNTKNLEAVAKGLSAEIENLLMAGQLFMPDSTVISIKKLSEALDDILEDVGHSAIASAQSGAISMKTESVANLRDDAIMSIKKHRQNIRNPYGKFNELLD